MFFPLRLEVDDVRWRLWIHFSSCGFEPQLDPTLLDFVWRAEHDLGLIHFFSPEAWPAQRRPGSISVCVCVHLDKKLN